MERLQKIIANLGYCSRRKAEELIAAGKVIVNGNVVSDLGVKVSKNDQIIVEGTLLTQNQKEYYLFNKPRGVVSTAKDEHNRKTVVDYIETANRIYPIGRLDYDTTGLMLLTNDGELANLIMHPKNAIEKVYVAKVKGKLGKENIEKLKRGIVIEKTKTAPAKVKILDYDRIKDTSLVRLTITEGKNQQVKKMFAAIDKPVIKLKREKISFLNLEGVAIGKYRKLNPKEIKKLYNECQKESNYE